MKSWNRNNVFYERCRGKILFDLKSYFKALSISGLWSRSRSQECESRNCTFQSGIGAGVFFRFIVSGVEVVFLDVQQSFSYFLKGVVNAKVVLCENFNLKSVVIAKVAF